jgi:hypothetical protein
VDANLGVDTIQMVNDHTRVPHPKLAFFASLGWGFSAREFTLKLRYLHRKPVVRGLVNAPAEWKWSSFRHYALREVGTVEIKSEWTSIDREVKPAMDRRECS